MTKNFLLAATALTAIGLAGGAAQAGEVSGAALSGVTVVSTTGTTTTSKVYYLASTAVQPTGATNFTASAFSATFIAGTAAAPTPLSNGTYRVRFELAGAGSPVFSTALSDGDITLNENAANCTVTKNVTLGGGAGQNFAEVTFAVSGAGCSGGSRPTSVTLSHPITISTAGSVTIGGSFTNVATGEPLGAGNVSGTQTVTTKTLVSTVAPFTLAVTADTVATRLSLTPTPVYSTLASGTVNGVNYDAVIGTISAANATVPADTATASTIYAGIAGSASAIPSSIVQTASVTGSDLSKVNVTIGSLTVTEAGNTATAAASALGSNPVSVVVDSGTPATQVTLSPLTFTGATTLSYPTSAAANTRFVNLAGETKSDNLQSVSLEGTNFVAPWFALQAAGGTTFLRLSNTGTTDTGPITLTLRSNNGGTVNATCTLNNAVIQDGTLGANGGLRANTQITVSGKTIANACFGTTATNADIMVTIQGNATDLTAKTRLLGADGSIIETSLGRLGDARVTF